MPAAGGIARFARKIFAVAKMFINLAPGKYQKRKWKRIFWKQYVPKVHYLPVYSHNLQFHRDYGVENKY